MVALLSRAVGRVFNRAGSRRDCCRQKHPVVMQHALNERVDPQMQGSLRPSFSRSSLSPWTTRWPRFTPVSDGKPVRRLRLVVKAEVVVVFRSHGVLR
jgi:hypothetical protein